MDLNSLSLDELKALDSALKRHILCVAKVLGSGIPAPDDIVNETDLLVSIHIRVMECIDREKLKGAGCVGQMGMFSRN